MTWDRVSVIFLLAALVGAARAEPFHPRHLHGHRAPGAIRGPKVLPPEPLIPYNNGVNEILNRPSPVTIENELPRSAPEGGGPAFPLPSPTPLPPVSGGMVITIYKTLRDNGEQEAPGPPPLVTRPKLAADRLGACWAPPLPEGKETVEVTLRFSFNSQGYVKGSPAITYVKAGKGVSANAVRESILAAIRNCTPLRFTESMARAAPGYTMAVRFIGRREE